MAFGQSEGASSARHFLGLRLFRSPVAGEKLIWTEIFMLLSSHLQCPARDCLSWDLLLAVKDKNVETVPVTSVPVKQVALQRPPEVKKREK